MNDIVTILIQYGLAGVVIYLFYTLITNDLRDLRQDIRELINEIKLLRVEIKNSRNRDKS
jgi:hypothetical protein